MADKFSKPMRRIGSAKLYLHSLPYLCRGFGRRSLRWDLLSGGSFLGCWCLPGRGSPRLGGSTRPSDSLRIYVYMYVLILL